MDKRSFLLGFGALLAAPAIVRADSLMKIAKLRASVDSVGIVSFGSQVFFLAADGFYTFHGADGLRKLPESTTWKFA